VLISNELCRLCQRTVSGKAPLRNSHAAGAVSVPSGTSNASATADTRSTSSRCRYRERFPCGAEYSCRLLCSTRVYQCSSWTRGTLGLAEQRHHGTLNRRSVEASLDTVPADRSEPVIHTCVAQLQTQGVRHRCCIGCRLCFFRVLGGSPSTCAVHVLRYSHRDTGGLLLFVSCFTGSASRFRAE